MKRVVVLAVDVEGMGANITHHHTTQFGAAVVDLQTGELLGTFNEFILKEELVTCDATDMFQLLHDINLIIGKPGPVVDDTLAVQEVMNAFYVKHVKRVDFEPRCEREFWDKHPERKAETLAMIHADETMRGHEVINNFVTWARALCKGCKVHVVTDTSGFDIGRIDKLFPLAKSEDQSDSMNYLFLDDTGKTAYNGIEQLTSFAKGIAATWWTSKPKGLGTFELACGALGVDVPKFDVEHDHNPANDATVIAQKYAFLCRACNKFVSNKN